MPAKVRVYEVAKELGLPARDLVDKIQSAGIAIRNHMSVLETDDVQRVKRLIERQKQEETIEEHIRPTVVRRRARSPVVAQKAAARASKQPVEEPEAGIEAPETAEQPVEPEPQVEQKQVSQAAAEASGAAVEPQSPVTSAAEESAAAQPPAAHETSGTGRAEAKESMSVPKLDISEKELLREEESDARKKGAPSSRRRELVRGKDLVAPGRSSRPKSGFSMPKARKKRAMPGKKTKKTEITTPKAIKRIIRIEETVSLQELAKRMGIKANDVLMKLIGMGMGGVNINSVLDSDTAKLVAAEFSYEVEDMAVAEEDLLASARADAEKAEAGHETRPPVITMMGHVDHGKTSLLDYIRKSHIVKGEAGGITQHIGAYRVDTRQGTLCFLDTPGHEAFTAIRSRGANTTDIVVLVVAADDGVMPQTVEAINHAKAAEVPIVVALNKMDLAGVDPEKVLRQLSEQGLVAEEWGGQVTVCRVSARTGDGLDNLLEMLNLQAEIMELDASPDNAAKGTVLEAYLDKGRGPVANVLVQDGTLTPGDIVVAGMAFGKVRALTNEFGQSVKKATPSTPVEILGLSDVPEAGNQFDVVSGMKVAQQISDSRQSKVRASGAVDPKVSLQDLFQKIQEGETQGLKLVVKADVQGSLEAMNDALVKLTNDEVRVEVIHSAVGGITESDVMLASASGAIIIGFNVRPAGKARKMAEEQKVEIKVFKVIYEAIDEVKKALSGLLEPIVQEEALGQAEVRDTFHVPKVGTIAGCAVIEGKVQRNAKARIIRDSVQVWEGKMGSLKRFKDDVKEVTQGYECGIGLDGFNDVKIGDVIEVFITREVRPEL